MMGTIENTGTRSWPIRKEGRAKVTGQAKYIDDLHFEGAWYGTTVRSTIARGRIKSIRFVGNLPWNEITVVSPKDIPGKNVVALLLEDQPFLADGVVNHPEEPILLLAHPNRYLLEEARQCVEIEYESLPPIFTIEESLAKKEIIWGADNILKKYLLEKGDVDSVWNSAALVIQGEYFTEAQEQLYIEPNGVVAIANSKEGVTIWGSMQCPYYIQKALMPLFNLPPEKVRIIQAETGGGFGGKEEYPSILAGHAALLSWKTGRPIKMIYDRAEDMVATTKRHPSRTRIQSAVDANGKLQALDIDFAIDGGAYATLSAVVLSRGTIHAAGPYLCPNVRIHARAVATNCPPHGAFRGFGAPQSIFALERHLDEVAEKIGITAEEIRRRNFIRQGEKLATNQIVKEPIRMDELFTQGLNAAKYHEKRARFEIENAKPGAKVKRGIGFATFMHGSGFTGSGERYLESVVGAELTPEGRIRILAASTEIGQGTNTIFTQIAADALGLPYDAIEVAQPDTGNVPNSGPTVASRTVMIVGKLVERAALSIRDTLVQSGVLNPAKEPFSFETWTEAARRYLSEKGSLRLQTKYQAPPGIFWDDEKYQGDAYGAFAWAVYVAEVAVDMTTFEVSVQDFVALQEVGKVMHPILARGQIEGGVAQGIGYALYEKVSWKDGRMNNGQMTNYIMPTSVDLPEIQVLFEEIPYAFGPSGAKGIGELPMDGPAPAILNAVAQALKIQPRSIPLTPERLMEKVQ